ncbi:hypothetical protein GXW82_42985 [Streptacidiphilus sp. 4-A2]|nr:hypothetical protein [Streptacidiphilus sp. 4-A2]
MEVARLLSETVAERSAGRSQLGLMSSWLDTTSVEGRDWPALFDALAVNGCAAHRPHFAPYTDAPGRELSFSVWTLELQRALRPAGVTSEPEIENWPHTAWSKADTQTWSEMVAAQLAGSDALLLNVHPMHAKRADRYPQVGDLLLRSRPALDWIADRRPRDLVTEGVYVPFKQDTATHVHTRTADLDDMAAGPGPAADFLLRSGVPITANPAAVAVLFGQLARALSDDELRQLLSGGLLLDGAAAVVLAERGFSRLIGLREADWSAGSSRRPTAPTPPRSCWRRTTRARSACCSASTCSPRWRGWNRSTPLGRGPGWSPRAARSGARAATASSMSSVDGSRCWRPPPSTNFPTATTANGCSTP